MFFLNFTQEGDKIVEKEIIPAVLRCKLYHVTTNLKKKQYPAKVDLMVTGFPLRLSSNAWWISFI